jgi:hypothetical protein
MPQRTWVPPVLSNADKLLGSGRLSHGAHLRRILSTFCSSLRRLIPAWLALLHFRGPNNQGRLLLLVTPDGHGYFGDIGRHRKGRALPSNRTAIVSDFQDHLLFSAFFLQLSPCRGRKHSTLGWFTNKRLDQSGSRHSGTFFCSLPGLSCVLHFRLDGWQRACIGLLRCRRDMEFGRFYCFTGAWQAEMI